MTIVTQSTITLPKGTFFTRFVMSGWRPFSNMIKFVRIATYSAFFGAVVGVASKDRRKALYLRTRYLRHLFSLRCWAVVVRSGAADHAANTSALTETR